MADIDIRLFSMNCNGLRDNVKRMAVMQRLKRQRSGIFLLQETHTTTDIEARWCADWGNRRIYFSHGSSNSKGVAVLISNDYDIQIHNYVTDKNGRYVILNVESNGVRYTLGNIYAPTRDHEKEQQDVLAEFTHILDSFDNENIIIAGDYNVYLDQQMDKMDNIRDTNDNNNYRTDLLSYLDVNNLVDAWRTINPTKKCFTWHRGNKRARLDYIFMSEHLLNCLETATILPGIQSDHSLLSLSLSSSQVQGRGRGFWKFNSSLLYDSQYVSQAKDVIKEATEKYSSMENKGMLWELIKLDVRTFTVPYCVNKKKVETAYENEINNKYNFLFNMINSTAEPSNAVFEEYYNTKSELENIQRHKAKGIILRSKCQWVEEGEKNTSFFLRLEKSNYANKVISKLNVRDNIITAPHEILEEEKNFYENLYSSSPLNRDDSYRVECENFFLTENQIPKISNQNRASCEEPVSEAELLKSLKCMKNGKSPGSDGLTVEFYKFFWSDIKNILLSSLNYALVSGSLSVEQRRGILSLLPKKDKDRIFLKNWRPISLLNFDYKLLAKVLASRLTKILPIVIDDDQTGYIKGRFIGSNIRVVEDTIHYTKVNNIPGIMVAIDFEKAFDSLSWSYIYKCLEAFNFGPNFIKYIKVLYNDISTAVINNGYTSSWFYPERGVRQGCPISPYLFILAVETLACKIRCADNVRGITINGTEIKISQLADDTTCLIKDIISLKNLLHIFDKYKVCSGLSINIDKTMAMGLGGFQPETEGLLGVDWTSRDLTILGVTISGDETDHYILNYKKRIKNMQQLLRNWKCRYLSLKGKITIVNSLALSPLLYLASVIHVPENVIKEVKSIILDFLWDGKTPKIAYNVLIQNIEQGGLKLIDFDTKIQSLKVSWIKRLADNKNSRWKAAPKAVYNTNNLEWYFKCNRARDGNIQPKFYRDIHNAWSDMNEVTNPDIDVIINQVIWNNRYITIDQQPYCWSNWINRNVIYINDLLDNNGVFVDHESIANIYGVNCTFLEILQIRQSIPLEWRRALSTYAVNANSPKIINRSINACFSGKVKPFISSKTKEMYQECISRKVQVPTSLERWRVLYPEITGDNWKDIFTRPFKTVRETKIQSFQYKIVHRIINCNKKLFDMRIKPSPICSFCDGIDDIKHFFFDCAPTNTFWAELFAWLSERCHTDFSDNNTEKVILFGLPLLDENCTVLNFCVLYGKYYVYRPKIISKWHIKRPKIYSRVKI